MVGGVSQQYFSTPMGARIVDQFSNGIAHESKVGYVSLTKSIKNQILKDRYLVQNDLIKGSHWHFFKSPKTGKIGPSKPLMEFMQQNGIKYTIHY